MNPLASRSISGGSHSVLGTAPMKLNTAGVSIRRACPVDSWRTSTPSRCPSPRIRRIAMLQRPIEFSQYLSIRYTERLAEAGIELSVGSTGDSHDNALAETVIGLCETEEIHRLGPWKGLEGVEFATLEWVAWYNGRRLLEPARLRPAGRVRAGLS